MSTETFREEEDPRGLINEITPYSEGVTEGEIPPLFEVVFSVGKETVNFTGGRGDEDG